MKEITTNRGNKMETTSNQHEQPHIGSAFDLLPKSWNLVKKHWQLFAFVNIPLLFSAVSDILSPTSYFGALGGRLPNTMPTYDQIADNLGGIILISIAVFLIGGFFYTMAVALELRTVDSQESTPNQLATIGKKFWLREIGLLIVSGLIVIAGLILFIVPGIFAFIRLYMGPYIMIDKDLGIIDSIKASNQLTKENMRPVMAVIGVFLLVSFGLSLLEIFPIFGVIVSTVVGIGISLITALRYREITKLSAHQNPAEPVKF